ncbi:MAG: PASTA domain-containing protein [Terracidiphilus sp.]
MKTGFFLNFFQIASLLMLLVAVALLSAITTMHFAIHGAEVTVPSLKGMTVTQARSLTAGLDLNLEVDNRYYSGEVTAGHILTQSPAPGTVVRREWRVRVSESLGPQKADVPQTVGQDERVAALELRRAGLDVGATAMLPYPGARVGTVLAQDPAAHTQGIARPSVDLLVAAPAQDAPDGFVMPDLVGLAAAGAQKELAGVGIQSTVEEAGAPVEPMGSGFAPPIPPVRPGAVMAQEPLAGTRVEQKTPVRLTVAR